MFQLFKLIISQIPLETLSLEVPILRYDQNTMRWIDIQGLPICNNSYLNAIFFTMYTLELSFIVFIKCVEP